MRKLASSLLAASALLFAGIGVVQAALSLEFEPPEGASGVRVTARSAGSGADPAAAGAGLPIWAAWLVRFGRLAR